MHGFTRWTHAKSPENRSNIIKVKNSHISGNVTRKTNCRFNQSHNGPQLRESGPSFKDYTASLFTISLNMDGRTNWIKSCKLFLFKIHPESSSSIITGRKSGKDETHRSRSHGSVSFTCIHTLFPPLHGNLRIFPDSQPDVSYPYESTTGQAGFSLNFNVG